MPASINWPFYFLFFFVCPVFYLAYTITLCTISVMFFLSAMHMHSLALGFWLWEGNIDKAINLYHHPMEMGTWRFGTGRIHRALHYLALVYPNGIWAQNGRTFTFAADGGGFKGWESGAWSCAQMGMGECLACLESLAPRGIPRRGFAGGRDGGCQRT